MFIRVLVEEEKELLFNTDCQVALLLDAIKRAHHIPRSETIDLCNIEGVMKELWKHLKDNALPFFKLRELCLVVGTHNTQNEASFTPYLKEYAENKGFEVTTLNVKEEKTTKTRFKGAGSSSVPRTVQGSVSAKKKSRRHTQYH